MTQTTQAVGDGTLDNTIEINYATSNGPTLSASELYGYSITNIGDMNSDGVEDMVAGSLYDNTGSTHAGAVSVHFMNSNGSVKSTVEINSTTPNGPLSTSFEYSITSMGDLDNDGIVDIAMATPYVYSTGNQVGQLTICFLNIDGSVKKTVSIDYTTLNGPIVAYGDYYGVSIANIGDMDGNGISDIAVGASYDGDGTNAYGAIHVHFLTNKAQTVTGTITTIGTTTATGNAEIIDIGTQNPERLIEWGIVSETYTDDCTAGAGALGTYSCDLTELTPYTTYYIRAKATNEKGNVYGEEQSFTTNALTNQVIPNPDIIEMNNLETNGYITVNNGTIDNTTNVSTNNAQITFQSNTTCNISK